MRRFHWLALTILLLPLFWFSPAQSKVIEGQVVDANGPVSAASVRIQGQCQAVRTDRAGTFFLQSHAKKGRLTATKKGYRIGWTDFGAGTTRILLDPLPVEDNLDYPWVDPAPAPLASPRLSKEEGVSRNYCGNCHQEIHREWAGSAHARSATNPRLLALFGGPDSLLGKDWNLLEQHPLGAGVCASCHAPTMSSPQLDYDLRTVKDVAAKGVHCDYCHKIEDAPVDKLGTRFGRDGYRLLRPQGDDQLFFGPLPDAIRPGDSFVHAPLYQESHDCASCHEGVIFGVHVYGTYSEWLASPAAKQGTQCQSCHMAPTGTMTNIAPAKGGIERDPNTLGSHVFPGGTEAMLKKCLQLQVAIKTEADETHVEVCLTADNVGHRVPTGFIDRHLVVVVEAEDSAGKKVGPKRGPLLPTSAGANFAAKAGFLYAKVLTDEAGRSPLPFWLPHETMSDTRLFPGQPDRRTYTFAAAARIRVRLFYRRLWPAVAGSMRWGDNEMVVFDYDFKPV
jgi:hypothetical protein